MNFFTLVPPVKSFPNSFLEINLMLLTISSEVDIKISLQNKCLFQEGQGRICKVKLQTLSQKAKQIPQA